MLEENVEGSSQQRTEHAARPRLRLGWEHGLYILLIVLALASRLWGLGDRVQSHDESIHSRYSWNLATGRGFAHDPMMHGPSLFHITALSFFLFGDNDFTSRLPVALIGAALVASPYLLRRQLGRAGALAAAGLLLISPAIAYYSRYIRHDIPLLLCEMIVVWALVSYLRDGRARWLNWLAAGVSLAFATMEAAFIYHAIFGFFLVGLFAVRALGRPWSDERLKPAFLGVLAGVPLGGALVALGYGLRPPGAAGWPWYALGGAVLAGLALAGAAALLLLGVWRQLRAGPTHDPALGRVADLIVVLGTLCLPLLSALPIALVGLDPIDYSTPTLYYSSATTGVVFALSVALGLAWDRQRWWKAAAIHYGIFVVLFTTLFTNGYGIGSGLVGSLGYWLKQHTVQRGGQPPYYYVVMVVLYEYWPLALSLAAVALLAATALRRRRRGTGAAVALSPRAGAGPTADGQSRVPILPFLVWWVVLSWCAYSIAGERMPWLTVHITLPMILLSGWLVGRVLEALDWRQLAERRAWWLGLLALAFLLALDYLGWALGQGPFAGHELEPLRASGRLWGAIVLVGALGAGLAYRAWRSGKRVVLSVAALLTLLLGSIATLCTAWRFCYINYDYPSEPLVYAHGAPGVNEVMRRLDLLSRRTAGGRYTLRVAYASEGRTFFYWQLRNYPNATYIGENPSREDVDVPAIIAGEEEWDKIEPYLGDDYVVYTFPYLWWPIEDYRDLTFGRIWRALTDPARRAALWDIWWDRDYGRYSELTGKVLTLDQWPYPYRKDVHLYVRRERAAQVWEESIARPTGTLPGPVEPIATPDPYASGWRDLAARLVFGSAGSGPGQLLSPRDLAVDNQGTIYVVDSGNHRIQKFAPDGSFVAAWGRQSLAEQEAGVAMGFNEPWGIGLAPDGTIFVADTWNYRIQKLSPQGEVLLSWDRYGDTAETWWTFYGPRDLAVSADGRLYVTDTGNKRIEVFDLEGRFLFEWGGPGIAEGFLDEPVGIAIGPGLGCGEAGCIYVADTWNQRIQVFDLEGRYLRQWPIAGWEDESIENKPYLAVDQQGIVYVTDPGNYRILVFDSVGSYLYSFGQYGFDERSFAWPAAVAVGPDGALYVTDAHAGRVLVFDVSLPGG